MSSRKRIAVAAAFTAALVAPGAANAAVIVPPSGTPVIIEFPGTAGGVPNQITAGPNGTQYMWFTDGGGIGQISFNGAVTDHATNLPANASLDGITLGPDDNLWFTDTTGDAFGRFDPQTDTASHLDLPSGSLPQDLASDDGELWVTEFGADAIVRSTVHGALTPFSAGLSPHAGPTSIAPGPNRELWFAESQTGKIGEIAPDGAITERQVAATPGDVNYIATGPDGSMYWTQGNPSEVGWITPDQSQHVSADGLLPSGAPAQLTLGPDQNMWFTDAGASALGTIDSRGLITEYTQGITGRPFSIAAGPGSTLWFTEPDVDKIARVQFCGPILCAGTIQKIAPGEQEITTSLAKPSAIGILVQRLTRRGKITIGRVPLGRHHGLVTIHWNQHVNSHTLPPGRYLVTLRALDRHKRVVESALPVVLGIS